MTRIDSPMISMGCGLAYHLAHEGCSDVVLLEKAELTSGSTWHAAGQITHSTSSFGLGKCVGYNIDLYSGLLEEETGQSVTWHVAASSPAQAVLNVCDLSGYVYPRLDPDAPTRSGGRISPPAGPGLGVTPNPAVLGEPVLSLAA